jgi:hypothetical protein
MFDSFLFSAIQLIDEIEGISSFVSCIGFTEKYPESIHKANDLFSQPLFHLIPHLPTASCSGASIYEI